MSAEPLSFFRAAALRGATPPGAPEYTAGTEMRPDERTPEGRGLEWLTPEVYDDLRARARAMSRGAPPTLAGTAGLHTALERLLRHRRTFRDRRHFTAYCLFLLRRLWISHARATRRRTRRDAAAVLPTLSFLAGQAVVPSGEEAVAMHELLLKLRADTRVARRRKIARAAECHLVAGFTQAETAELLGESKAMVQQRLAFFAAWARIAIAPELAPVEAAVAEMAADPRLARGPAVAEAARRHFVCGEPRAAVAEALGVDAARVDDDLRLFAAWVAARSARAGGTVQP
jgi:DNA-directed RNA polymerase specialized sigma24 family protein